MKKTLVFVDKQNYKLEHKFFNSILSDELEINSVYYGTRLDFGDYVPDNIDKYSDIIVILNDVLLEDSLYSNKRHERLGKSEEYNSKFFDVNNFKSYFKSLPSNTKYIYLDNNGESNTITHVAIYDWLNLENQSTHLISSRFYHLEHHNSTVGLSYLPILYMFTEQNFSQFPMLNYSPPSKPKYDFITYLGQSTKPQNITTRFKILNSIFKNDLTGIKYQDDSNFKADDSLFGKGQPGHYWNVLNSLSAKIQIIFETYAYRPMSQINHWDYSEFFFTEKIMKCFVLPHPYLLIVNKNWLNLLEPFGFKFHESSKGDTIEDFQNIIDNIKKDPDKWISDNTPYFEHNQRNLYEISKSIELPHHKILKKLLIS